MTSKHELFECTQCGDCCKGYGGTYLTEADIKAIADYLQISTTAFKASYCTSSGNRLVLAQRSDGYCIFWEKNCTIHSVKPRMCRKWPFIDSLLVDIANWRIMASVCPGMQTDLDDAQLIACVRAKMSKMPSDSLDRIKKDYDRRF